MPSRFLGTSFALLAVLALGACARYPGGVAPSNVPLEPGGYEVLGPVAGQDCKVMLLGILPISGGNQVKDAVTNALAQRKGADALVDISVDLVSKWFILWSQTCTEVRATAVRRS